MPSARPVDDELSSLRGTETILLVEDDENVRIFFERVLCGFGYQVIPVSHGADALAIANRYTAEIHLLLSDVVLPKMSGRELAEKLVALRPQTKVLFASGYTENAIVHDGAGRAMIMHCRFKSEPGTEAW